MASACVNNVSVSPESFPASKFRSYGWLTSRVSVSRDESSSAKANANAKGTDKSVKNRGNVSSQKPDLEISGEDFVEFEFRLDDPVTMLPADELFSDGKLVPTESIRKSSVAASPVANEVKLPEKLGRRSDVSASLDPYLCSPKAPRCSSRWKEILGLKKLYQNSNAAAKPEDQKTTNSRSIRSLLHRSSKSSDSSLNLPLLKDLDTDSSVFSISSRLSLSSSSSSSVHEHEDLPRLSLDLDNKPSITRNVNMSRVRLVRHKSAFSTENAAITANAATAAAARAGRSSVRRAPEFAVRGVSVDSPRMNSSGKIVFHSLERSSSSPSTFNGGPRYKQRGMERSYSSNVRVTPVLNVPVCRFPLFSQTKKETGAGGSKNQVNYNKCSRISDRI